MKKLRMLMIAVLATGFLGASSHLVWAIKPFEEEFKKTYYKPDSADANEKKLADAIDKITTGEDENKQSCVICHSKGSKKVHNDYGKALAELLDRKKEEDKQPEKIQAALKKVAGLKSPAGPNFGELIGKGELPGGEPK